MSSFCVIGLGRFGQTIATELEKNGHQVLIIDYNAAVVNALSDMVTNAVVGDPMNPDVLRAAGVKNYDCAVVCFSERINDSIIVTMMLKEMGIKKVVVRANSEIDKKILYKIGADSVVFPEQDMRFAAVRAEFSAGRSIPARIAMIAIVMSSSIRVNLGDFGLRMMKQELFFLIELSAFRLQFQRKIPVRKRLPSAMPIPQ